MKLKELLDSIKLKERDNIFVWYKMPRDKYLTNLSHDRWETYYECDVTLKVNDCQWTDPISGQSGFCKQYSIELDWDEVRIIKERNTKTKKDKQVKL